MCKTKSQNEAGGNSLCLVGDRHCFHSHSLRWLEHGYFSVSIPFSSVESAAAWTLTLCVRSHVLMCHEYWRNAVWRGAWQVNHGWFFLTLVKVICRPIATSGASQTERECGSVHILPSVRWPRRVAAPQTCDSCITLRAGEADLSNLTVDSFFFLGWLDGCFSLNVDSGSSTRSFEKNDQSLALQAGFFQLPGRSGGIQWSLHSTWRTGVEPALLSAADVIWVGVNLWGQQTKKKKVKNLYL